MAHIILIIVILPKALFISRVEDEPTPQSYNKVITKQQNFQVGKDITNLKMFVLTYNKDFGFDTTENWTYDWTFPKSLLLVVTIMTTIGGFFVSKFEGFL